jgi:hypothetical protein
MTPKEKALELIEKFKINDYDWIAQGNLYCVKQHVLITVDEILSMKIVRKDDLTDEYWEAVKQEIQKL